MNLHVDRPGVLADNLIFLEFRNSDDVLSPDASSLLDAMKSVGKQCTMMRVDENISEAAVYGDRVVVQRCPCRACVSCLLSKGILDPFLIPYYELSNYEGSR